MGDSVVQADTRPSFRSALRSVSHWEALEDGVRSLADVGFAS
jgi:hypothetical protein